jgi:glutaredoxin-like YruB-family protein
MTKSVKVYGTETCPYCLRLKEYLKQHNVVFENIDVGENTAGREEMMTKSGQMGVPVLDIEGKIIVGFDRTAVAAALDIHENV